MLSNGGFLQSEEGLAGRTAEIKALNEHFDQAIQKIHDPYKDAREDKMMQENPLFAAGLRQMDKLKWDMFGGQLPAQQLREQGF